MSLSYHDGATTDDSRGRSMHAHTQTNEDALLGSYLTAEEIASLTLEEQQFLVALAKEELPELPHSQELAELQQVYQEYLIKLCAPEETFAS